MKSVVIALIIATSSCMVLLAESNQSTPQTKEERMALRAERIRQVGGIVRKEGNGRAVVVNVQHKFPESRIKEALTTFTNALKFNFETRSGTWKFGDAIPADANIAMFVVDDSSLPMSLVASEAKWGVMNVAPLTDEKQFDREFLRVAIAVFGAGVSQYKVSPMQPIYRPEDLNNLVGTTLTVDAIVGINMNFEKLGFTKPKMASYKKACEMGWAPAPTNDIQKAIWDKVHAMPKNPMKIDFDPKKGR